MKCDRPGCTGTIEDDGYCDVCGHKSTGPAHPPTADPSGRVGAGPAPGAPPAGSLDFSRATATGRRGPPAPPRLAATDRPRHDRLRPDRHHIDQYRHRSGRDPIERPVIGPGKLGRRTG